MIYLNGTPINVTIFPDHTSQVWKIPEHLFGFCNPAVVKWTFDHEGEFVQLAQLTQLLHQRELSVSLILTYLPYGRQDKSISNESTFALHTFAYLINLLDFESVQINDPHSDVALALIDNSSAVYPDLGVQYVIEDMETDIVCYPDKGALEKYSKIYSHPFIYGEKVRDQATGNILNYQVIGDSAGKKVLIIDDICDGGMTFKILAKDLLAAGAKEVNLFVTHGIFSKGLKTLKESGINRIFTPDGEALEIQGNVAYETLQ